MWLNSFSPTYCNNLSSALSLYHIFSSTSILIRLKSRILKSVPITYLSNWSRPLSMFRSSPPVFPLNLSFCIMHLHLFLSYLNFSPWPLSTKDQPSWWGGETLVCLHPCLRLLQRFQRHFFFSLKNYLVFLPFKFSELHFS